MCCGLVVASAKFKSVRTVLTRSLKGMNIQPPSYERVRVKECGSYDSVSDSTFL
jgi:hypothetical protein